MAIDNIVVREYEPTRQMGFENTDLAAAFEAAAEWMRENPTLDPRGVALEYIEDAVEGDDQDDSFSVLTLFVSENPSREGII